MTAVANSFYEDHTGMIWYIDDSGNISPSIESGSTWCDTTNGDYKIYDGTEWKKYEWKEAEEEEDKLSKLKLDWYDRFNKKIKKKIEKPTEEEQLEIGGRFLDI